MTRFEVSTTSTKLVFEVLDDKKVALIQVGSNDLSNVDEETKKQMTLTEVQVTGENIHHKGVGFVATEPGSNLQYLNHQVINMPQGKQLAVVQINRETGLKVTNYYQLYDDTEVIRSWVTLENIGEDNLGIEYVSSFALTGVDQAGDLSGNYAEDNIFYVANNDWTAEAQWKANSLKDAGLDYWVDGNKEQASSKRISITNNSSWSC